MRSRIPSEERALRLELKLLADVGLVGFPNVGKSTLISRVSAARPKIADYPFTTLHPNLGVVAVGDVQDEISYVIADIPGLIEGASEGAGLGIQFLRHIERTRLLAHLIDVSDASGHTDPVKDYDIIVSELEKFGAGLELKPNMLIASKVDVANPEKLDKLKKFAKRKKLDFYPISAVTGEGIEAVKWAMARKVADVRRAPVLSLEDSEESEAVPVKKKSAPQKKKAASVKTEQPTRKTAPVKKRVAANIKKTAPVQKKTGVAKKKGTSATAKKKSVPAKKKTAVRKT